MRSLAGLSREAHVYRAQDFADIRPHYPYLADKARMDSTGHLEGRQEHRFPPVLPTTYGMLVILLINLDTTAGLVNGTPGQIIESTPPVRAIRARADDIATTGEFTRC